MRSREQFVTEYAESHQNLLNEIIHLICVPAIFFSTCGLLWLVPIGRWIPGMPTELAPWCNLATLAFFPIGYFYTRLGLGSLITGIIWMLLSGLGNAWIQSAGLPLLWISVATWLIAWVIQVYGHKVEGAKPSFVDDLVFLLIGPLFVTDKYAELLRTGSLGAKAH